jgi:hypothetical protein
MCGIIRVRQEQKNKTMQTTTITFREPTNAKYKLRQISRELGFHSTTGLIIAAIHEYLVKRNIEV